MKPEQVDSWKCATCGRVYRDREVAELCCICQKCGKESGNGLNNCIACQHDALELDRQDKYERALAVAWDEYDGAGVYVEGVGREYIFGDWRPEEIVALWEEYNKDVFPGFDKLRIWGIYSEPIELDVDEIEERLNDGAYEDYEVDWRMHTDLVALCDEWNAKHADKCYWPDAGVRIVYEGGQCA